MKTREVPTVDAKGMRLTEAMFDSALSKVGLEWSEIDVFTSPDVWSDMCAIFGGSGCLDHIRNIGVGSGTIDIATRGASPDLYFASARIVNLGSSPSAGKPVEQPRKHDPPARLISADWLAPNTIIASPDMHAIIKAALKL